ncbi:MAG: phosphate/phosphite/phosphonate ABC transporter substrate-binding protein [Verrucomicrobia bacterium]|nr:phosphate/phosphite/phosphonate ABC transporter substrate-binding protein [Verrucomicrobiota bacterium]
MKFRFLLLVAFAVTLRAEDLSLLVLDPLAAPNACACVAGYAQRDYEAFAAHLGKSLNATVPLQFAPILAGKPSLVIGKQTEIEHAAKASGLKLTRVAMLTDLKGSTNLHGLFVVRAKDRAKTLADLKGKRILFGPDGSDEKHAAALAALKQAGVPVPGKIEARDTCSQSAIEVAERNADAAVISSYAMPLLEGCGTIAKGELRIIGRTGEVPFIALYVADESLVPRLEKALAQLTGDSQLLDKMESAKGFVVVKKK